jgi:hypothetical protein
MKDRFSHPKNAAIEIIILIGAVYNFAVTARWQGWGSADFTVGYGAVVWALLIDGGYFAALFMLRDTLYKGQDKHRAIWRASAFVCGFITFTNTLLFNAAHWHPDQVPTEALGWIGSMLNFLINSGIELVIKALVPVIALYPLAMVPPVRSQSLEEVLEETKVEQARERARLELATLRREHHPKAAEREAARAENLLLISLRAQLMRAGVRSADRLPSQQVKVKAAAMQIWNPQTNAITDYQPKPIPPFKLVLEVAQANGLVSADECAEAEEFLGTEREAWEAEVRQRVADARMTPEVPSTPVSASFVPGSVESPAAPFPTPIQAVGPAIVASLPLAELEALLKLADQMTAESWATILKTRVPTLAALITAEQVPAILRVVRELLVANNGAPEETALVVSDPKQTALLAYDGSEIPRQGRYTLTEVARYCGIARSTLALWEGQRRLECHRRHEKPPWFDQAQLQVAIQQTEPERQKRAQTKRAMHTVPSHSKQALEDYHGPAGAAQSLAALASGG